MHLAVFFYGVLFQLNSKAKKPVCVKFLKRRFPTLNKMNSTLISNQASSVIFKRLIPTKTTND